MSAIHTYPLQAARRQALNGCSSRSRVQPVVLPLRRLHAAGDSCMCALWNQLWLVSVQGCTCNKVLASVVLSVGMVALHIMTPNPYTSTTVQPLESGMGVGVGTMWWLLLDVCRRGTAGVWVEKRRKGHLKSASEGNAIVWDPYCVLRCSSPGCNAEHVVPEVSSKGYL